MKRVTKISVVFLGVAAILVVVFTTMEAMGGPTFRAADHATLQECMANIPSEWALGSLERTRAETACHYQMEQRARQQQ